MRTIGCFLLLWFAWAALLTAQQEKEPKADDGWLPLFDGKTLSGWKANAEGDGVFSVKDGALEVSGGRAHLFYVGDVHGGTFKNFEFRAKVKTTVGANSGIYFHTAFQEEGWPSKGYECQINTSHRDPRKTGSLYGIRDVVDRAPSRDGRWFDCYIKVEGKNIVIEINGRQVVDYTEPDDLSRPASFAGRRLGEGTFALQAHDPKCLVYYRDIYVKPLD